MRFNSLVRAAALPCALAVPGMAYAGTCEDTFQKKGSPISGLRFIATASVPDLPPDVAINQMRAIAAGKGYDIMASEPTSGALLIEQPMSGKARAFPVEINATQAGGVGMVVMEAKLRAGMMTPEAAARTEMCAMLAELKGGKAGRTAAASGSKATTVQGAPVVLNALSFSQQISKDTERNPAAVRARYIGKRYTVTGLVDYVMADSGTQRVAFRIPNPWEEVLRLPNAAAFKTDISCMMAAGQSVYTMQLKPGKSVKLTGTVFKFDEYKHVVWLNDCVPAK